MHSVVPRNLSSLCILVCCILAIVATVCLAHDESDDLLPQIVTKFCSKNASISQQSCFDKVLHSFVQNSRICAYHSDCAFCQHVFLEEYIKTTFIQLNFTNPTKDLRLAFAGPLYWTLAPKMACAIGNLSAWSLPDFVEAMSHWNVTQDPGQWFGSLFQKMDPYQFDRCLNYSKLLDVSHQSSNLQVGFIAALYILNGYTIQYNCQDVLTLAYSRETLFKFLKKAGPESNYMVDLQDLKSIIDKMKLTESHDGHSHYSLTEQGVEPQKYHDGHDHDHDDEPMEDCGQPEKLMRTVASNGPSNDSLAWSQFKVLCPVLVEQAVTGRCKSPQTAAPTVTNAQKYGYGTLSVFVISLISMSGVLLIPILGSKFFDAVMTYFVAMAIGTLAGDAILHLIPQVLDSTEGGHSHDSSHLGKTSLICTFIYLLFLVESLLNAYEKHKQKLLNVNVTSDSTFGSELSVVSNATYTETTMPSNANSIMSSHGHSHGGKTGSHGGNGPQNSKLVSYVLLICEAVHNFADGMAIGASFSKSLTLGLTTSIAIGCHELPHELGDFAVLLSSGFSVPRALMYNLISALTAFIGLYIGLATAGNDSAQKWIFAVTIGMFLYISLVNMIPSLKSSKTALAIRTQTILENVGMLTGFGLMIGLTFFEGQS